MSNWINAKTRLPNDESTIFMFRVDDQIFSGKGCNFNNNLKPKNVNCHSNYYTHWKLRGKA